MDSATAGDGAGGDAIRIPLDNQEFEGRNNAYLFEGAVPTLIDTGVATTDVRDQLAAGLAKAGYEFADIEQVLITHWHADHAGLAATVAEAGGATVRAGRADAPLVARDPTAEANMDALYDERFDAWGMPAGPRTALEEVLETGSILGGDPVAIDPLTDGDRVQAGDGTLRAVALSGHTVGLTGFVRADQLYAGDALLPKYTPNIGGADLRVERPLATYLDTLVDIASAGYDRAFPGHRDPITTPRARARTIAGHHYDRARRVLDVLDAAETPLNAWTVSARLFGDLENIHILHGPGEATAHLDHLVDAGLVTRRGETPVTYELATQTGLEGAFPALARPADDSASD